MLRSASINSASYFSDNGANSTARHSASQDIKPSKAYEAAKLIALRTLKALSKTSVSAVQLDEVPKELLFGERVDLHRWTMILTDNNLKELSEQQSSGKLYYLDGSAAKVMNMFDSFYRPMKLKSGLLELNIANAKDITNYGIAMVSGTIKSMLSGQFAESRGEISFPEIPSIILEKLIQYLYYKVRYTNATYRIPEFVVEPEIALELLVASGYLDC
jgi:transcription elongation factor B subunit 1